MNMISYAFSLPRFLLEIAVIITVLVVGTKLLGITFLLVLLSLVIAGPHVIEIIDCHVHRKLAKSDQ